MHGSAPCPPRWSTAPPCTCSTSSRCGCPRPTRCRRALAAALALGETLGSTGAKILTAMVLGIEIQGRLRQAAGALESHELHFHPPGFVGPIGAAVAAGHLLDFDADQFANAIGIAGSRCGGLFVNLGTMTKATHCAYAAALGLEAALLTRRGFTGCRTLFDPAPQSYAEAFFPRGFAGRGAARFRRSRSGSSIRATRSRFSPRSSRRITRSPPPCRRDRKSPPPTRSAPCASLRPTCRRATGRSRAAVSMANSACNTRPRQHCSTGMSASPPSPTSAWRAPTCRRCSRKIEVRLSRDIPSIYTAGRYLDLEVTLADGKTIRTRCERPRGSWGAAPITAEEHLGKARDCLATHLAPDAVATCVAACCEIDSLDAQDGRRAAASRQHRNERCCSSITTSSRQC